MKPNILFWSYLAHFFLEWEMFQTRFVEKIKTHFVFRKSCRVWENVEKYRVFQKDLNIFYSGHRGHQTWHPVMFSYGDTLKTMPTNHKLQDRFRAAVQTIEGEQVS